MSRTERILGIEFFNGSVEEAVAEMCGRGGLLVVPAAPALVNIQYDAGYREALLHSDVAIADSGAMVLLWKRLKKRQLARISGLAYLKRLLASPELRERDALFLVLPNESAQAKALVWLRARGFDIDKTSCYIAPHYQKSPIGHGQSAFADERLLDLLGQMHPRHLIIGLGGGVQEKLGLFLRDNLHYRPAIHCIGAALGFLTGDQKSIPDWADKFYLGWLLRLTRDPRLYFRRFAVARELPGLIRTYGSELPPMKTLKS